jgi:hypothetical protein
MIIVNSNCQDYTGKEIRYFFDYSLEFFNVFSVFGFLFGATQSGFIPPVVDAARLYCPRNHRIPRTPRQLALDLVEDLVDDRR